MHEFIKAWSEGGVFRLFTRAFQNLTNAHAMRTRLSNSNPHSPPESLGMRLALVPLCVLILGVHKEGSTVCPDFRGVHKEGSTVPFTYYMLSKFQ